MHGYNIQLLMTVDYLGGCMDTDAIKYRRHGPRMALPKKVHGASVIYFKAHSRELASQYSSLKVSLARQCKTTTGKKWSD